MLDSQRGKDRSSNRDASGMYRASSGPSLAVANRDWRSALTGVHHKIDRATSTENVGTRYHGSSAIKPVRWSRIVEGSCLGVELHVLWVDTRPVDPWVVQVALTTLDHQDLELVIEVG